MHFLPTWLLQDAIGLALVLFSLGIFVFLRRVGRNPMAYASWVRSYDFAGVAVSSAIGMLFIGAGLIISTLY